jgi:hypothetical protein
MSTSRAVVTCGLMSFRIRRYGNRQTDVPCPGCSEGTLYVIVSCMSTSVTCRDCHAAYTLSELSDRLAPDEFARLEEAVGDRTSDRV